ncbi:MAG: 2'-5' RNA ligase [Chloroflexi bacterium OLB15]|nr:MAG: 2'-5' RNA ligase [Chloroflexi bacterium OLB15]
MSYRLFIALDLPETVKTALAALRAPIEGAAWVKPEGFHITLKFLGDGNDDARLEAVQAALAGIEARAFDYALRGVGRFPDAVKQPARVLWVGIQAADEFSALWVQVENTMAKIGFLPERHPQTVRPHITLARIKKGGNAAAITAFLERHHGFQMAGLRATEFCLFSSQLSPQGATYTRMGSYFLK